MTTIGQITADVELCFATGGLSDEVMAFLSRAAENQWISLAP